MVSADEVVHLNVGGVEYSAAAATLCAREGLLSGLVLGHGAVRDDQGRLFIDRNGDLFRYILDFLRDNELRPPSGFCEWGALKREFRYFFGSSFTDFECSDGGSARNSTPDAPAATPPATEQSPCPSAAQPDSAAAAPAEAGGQLTAARDESTLAALRDQLRSSQEQLDALKQVLESKPAEGAVALQPAEGAAALQPAAVFEADGVVVRAVPVPGERRIALQSGDVEVGSATRLDYNPATFWLTNEAGVGYRLHPLSAALAQLCTVAAAAGVPHESLSAAVAGDVSPLVLSPPPLDPTAALLRYARRQVKARSARGHDHLGVRPPPLPASRAAITWAAWEGRWGAVSATALADALLDDGFDVVSPGQVGVAAERRLYRTALSASGRDVLAPIGSPLPVTAGFVVLWGQGSVSVRVDRAGRVRPRFRSPAIRNFAFECGRDGAAECPRISPKRGRAPPLALR
eukprot:TRINITY_DN26706_c0_g1_i1.p1 TRINITY_DN26706_c0_g1~~TRINITY_DN26706_c0_g1_i1.p1  ORF type:complete len:461 (+),score=139.56 TRINITY_DN26706_c0_g1_i1:85-1467(+)